jgi:hypothetical protein
VSRGAAHSSSARQAAQGFSQRSWAAAPSGSVRSSRAYAGGSLRKPPTGLRTAVVAVRNADVEALAGREAGASATRGVAVREAVLPQRAHQEIEPAGASAAEDRESPSFPG